LDAATLGRAEEFWTLRLGCAAGAFRTPGLTVVENPRVGVFVVATARGIVAAAPSELHAALARTRDPRVLVTWDGLRPLVPAHARTVGAAWIGYASQAAGSAEGVRPVDSAGDPALASLRASVTDLEWRHANLDAAEPPIFAVVAGGAAVAASGSQRLLDRVAHIGVVTGAATRGQGLGRRAVAAALARALELGLLPQYQTLVANTPARRIADALGFAHFATTLSASW
jgi:GNAT superfamily N-acetyltransferase